MPARMMEVRFFATHYGWTEEQAGEEISLEAAEWLPKIEEAHARAAEKRQRDAEHGSGRERR